MASKQGYAHSTIKNMIINEGQFIKHVHTSFQADSRLIKKKFSTLFLLVEANHCWRPQKSCTVHQQNVLCNKSGEFHAEHRCHRRSADRIRRKIIHVCCQEKEILIFSITEIATGGRKMPKSISGIHWWNSHWGCGGLWGSIFFSKGGKLTCPSTANTQQDQDHVFLL